MKKTLGNIVLLVVACVLCIGMAISASAEEPETKIVEKALTTSVQLGGEANVEGGTNFKAAGWAGMKITVGDKDIVVTEVGRYCTARSSTTHNLLILNSDYSILQDGMVATRPEGAEDGFVYAKLEGDRKVTLQKNTTYYIVGDFASDRDMFYDAAVSTTTSDATIDGVVVLEWRTDIDNWLWCDYPALDLGWGPMDIKYEIEEPVEPEVPMVTVERTLTTSVQLGGEANVEGGTNFKNSGWAGMKITVGDQDIVVTEVGRYCTARSNTTHNLLILNASYLIVRDGLVATRQRGTEDGFVYAKLAEDRKVTLKKNTTYYIVTDFSSDLDMFYDAAVSTTTDDAAIDGVVVLEWRPEIDNWQWCDYPAPNIGWGPMDIKYEIEVPAELADQTEPTESTEPSESTEPTESTESTEPTEPTKPENKAYWVPICICAIVLIGVCAFAAVRFYKKRKNA